MAGEQRGGRAPNESAILHAPSAARNQEPISNVLRRVLPETGSVLEIASGSGQHIVAFAAAFPDLMWQPSDPTPAARASVAARVAQAGADNLRLPLALDVTEPGWERPIGGPVVDALVCINMLHIAPWRACEGLMQGAARLLRNPGVLYLYGPYARDGRHTAPSNAAFDRDLRQRNPDSGVRDLTEVTECAGRYGLRLDHVIEMPANNLSVVFRTAD